MTDYLAERRMLLVLDNCEHLLGACAQLVDHLLRHCRELRALATSREVLAIAGEAVWHVPSLAVPAADQELTLEQLKTYESVKLFVDRASAVEGGFDVNLETAQAIAQLCARLDGMPLAIELAAARINVLTVDQICQRLDDRFRLLTEGNRSALPRQQTLGATVSWSYALLTLAEQIMFDRLSVFAGGWEVDGAESVCAGRGIEALDILDLLTRLVRKSLVLVEPTAGHGSLRFRLLDTLRQFAAQRLADRGETDAIREEHAAYYLSLAEKSHSDAFTQDRGERPGRVLRLELEHDNFRAALAWLTTSGSTERALRLAGSLGWFWEARGYVEEGRERLNRLLADSAEAEPRARLAGLLAASGLAWSQADYAAQERLATESLSIARQLDDRVSIARSLALLGQAANVRNDYALAKVRLEECIEVCRRQPVGTDEAVDLAEGGAESLLGNMARDQGDFDTALRSYEAALAHETSDSQRGHILSNMGWLYYYWGRLERGRAVQEESLLLRRQLNEPRSIAVSLSVLARIALSRGDRPTACALSAEALPLHKAVGNQWGVAVALEGIAALAAECRPEHAVRLASAAAAMRSAIGRPLPPAEQPLFERFLAPARRALSPADQTAAWEDGASLSLRQAVAEAKAEVEFASAEFQAS